MASPGHKWGTGGPPVICIGTRASTRASCPCPACRRHGRPARDFHWHTGKHTGKLPVPRLQTALGKCHPWSAATRRRQWWRWKSLPLSNTFPLPAYHPTAQPHFCRSRNHSMAHHNGGHHLRATPFFATPVVATKPCTRRVTGRMPEIAAKMAALPTAAGGRFFFLKNAAARIGRAHCSGEMVCLCQMGVRAGGEFFQEPALHALASEQIRRFTVALAPLLPLSFATLDSSCSKTRVLTNEPTKKILNLKS